MAKPAAQAVADTVKKTAPDTVDNSWPGLVCASPEAMKRRHYDVSVGATRKNARNPAKVDTAWKNQNGLIEDQQKLADVLACEKESDFVLRTGVDFTSADGFVGKNADLRASIAYNINLGGRWLPFIRLGRVTRLAITIRAERLSALVQRSHFACVGSVEPWSPGDGAQAPRLPENCALPVLAGDSTTQTVFRPASAPFQPDDNGVRGTWNVSTLARYETPLFASTGVLVGPALSASFNTDPTAGASRGLATSVQGGLSLRQLENRLERFSLLVLWGRLYQFRENVYSYDSIFVKAHPEVASIPGAKATADGVDVEFGKEPRTNLGMSLQMIFQPLPKDIPNLFFRGAADFPHGGHRSASLAILLQGDLGALLKGLGITTTPAKN